MNTFIFHISIFRTEYFREYQESRRYNETRHDDPVFVVNDVNHAQVASGMFWRATQLSFSIIIFEKILILCE